MSRELEKRLRAEARKNGLKGEDLDKYVTDEMRKEGLRPRGK